MAGRAEGEGMCWLDGFAGFKGFGGVPLGKLACGGRKALDGKNLSQLCSKLVGRGSQMCGQDLK